MGIVAVRQLGRDSRAFGPAPDVGTLICVNHAKWYGRFGNA